MYAVETDDVIQIAREAAHANGFADRIEFIQAMPEDRAAEYGVWVRVELIGRRGPGAKSGRRAAA